ncbi:hypothetical protein GMOD_00000305 [Pyrenophora seminiperda CCB06]|uniref:Uncharacterized protein n=1 Tax=Pyrenophora seminiperda CCB06 TaxID=1302712 RepID=A0A3M7M6Z5_9PLEO|nr:hypothetical protein GMOD_00000305 [Pyrenophora seminiperda CCB06]
MELYRDFDCYDPAARAPTPLPPMSLGDYGEEEKSAEKRDNSTLSTSLLDKASAPSADQRQRKDSLVTFEADQVNLASSPVQSELSDCPSDLSDPNVHGPSQLFLKNCGKKK